MHDEVSTRAPQIAEFSHVAYCSGPFQLAILLSALAVCGVPPANCTVMPFAGVSNDDVSKTLRLVCKHLGMTTRDESVLPSPTLKQVHALYSAPRRGNRSAFWYCRGGLWPHAALIHLQKALPDVTFEYYDGFRSPMVALEQGKNRLSLSDANDIGDLRQLAVQRLMRPDRHFMTDDGLFTSYAPAQVRKRTHYMPLNAVRDKIRLVGQILDAIDGAEPLEDGPGAVLLTGMFSERRKSVSLADELKIYADTLAVVRSVSDTAPVLVKAHPRTSYEKMRGLEEICDAHGAALNTRQQLVEYILEKSGRHDVAVIGPPSTALLSTLQFGYGRAFCLSQRLMASYVGPEYAGDPWMAKDHELMETAGVRMVDSLQQLRDMLRSKGTS